MEYRYAILGAGASGLLLAEALSGHPELGKGALLLVEKDEKTGNDRTWCFWEEGEGVFDPIVHHQWERIEVAGPGWSMDESMEPFRYKMIRSSGFYAAYGEKLRERPNVHRIRASVEGLAEEDARVRILTDQGTFFASQVFSSLPPIERPDFSHYPLVQQHFLGWFVRMDRSVFEPNRVTFMDFSIPQEGNTRFMYILPLSETEALLEYTLFSGEILEEEAYESGIREYIGNRYPGARYEITEKEQGVIPMTCYPFWKATTERVIPIGLAGGWAKPSSGYAFARSARESRRLVEHLAAGKSPLKFFRRSRFWYYDLLLLDILSHCNHRGSSIFLSLFRKRKVPGILRFLDEQSDFALDLSMMGAPNPWLFLRAIRDRLWRGF